MRHSIEAAALVLAIIFGTICPSIAATQDAGFIYYPGFLRPGAQIEMVHDKGLTMEIIVNCGGGRAGIILASKPEKLFCGPTHHCVSSLKQAVKRLCH